MFLNVFNIAYFVFCKSAFLRSTEFLWFLHYLLKPCPFYYVSLFTVFPVPIFRICLPTFYKNISSTLCLSLVVHSSSLTNQKHCKCYNLFLMFLNVENQRFNRNRETTYTFISELLNDLGHIGISKQRKHGTTKVKQVLYRPQLSVNK